MSMTSIDFGALRWFTSTASGDISCVEVAYVPGGGVAVRNSRERARPPHVFSDLEWATFLTGVRNGEFDIPA
jgi:hypothetical protein